MATIQFKGCSFSQEDFHRACQTGLAMRIERKFKLVKHDFDNMAIEDIENIVKEYDNK